MKKRVIVPISFGLLFNFALADSVFGSDHYLKQSTALDYFHQGKALKCFNPNAPDAAPVIVTNGSFEALSVSGFTFFQQQDPHTGDVIMGNASYCLLD